jgi:hypothetical protein
VGAFGFAGSVRRYILATFGVFSDKIRLRADMYPHRLFDLLASYAGGEVRRSIRNQNGSNGSGRFESVHGVTSQ